VGNILTWRQQADSTAVLWKYGYDPADQLTSAVKHATDTPQTVLQRFVYAYDPAGNRTVEQIDDAITLSAYDHLNRLTSQVPGGPMTIAGLLDEPGTVTISGVPAVVDASHNFRGTVPTTVGTNTFTVVAKDVNGNTTTQQYEVDLAGIGRTFTYDANGNLTSDGTRTLEWDAQNRLLAVEVGSTTSDVYYNGLHQWARIVEKNAGVTQTDKHQLWCANELCEERTSAATTRYFTSSDQVDGAAKMRFADHLAGVHSVSDASGTLLSQYAYDPYGRRTLASGAESSEHGFTGLRRETSTGLWLAEFRAYDASLGRWISEDPLGLQGGINLYGYVEGRPTVARDPSGLVPVLAIIKLVTMAATVYFATQTCVSIWQCNRSYDLCVSESRECARKLAGNIMSPQYHQREQICFGGNVNCQTMLSACPGIFKGFFRYGVMPRRF
jgi:RHS repeat-associated protein